MADQQAQRSLPRKLNGREFDFDVSSIARMRQCNQDTMRLIAGGKREVATSYALLAELDRILARTDVLAELLIVWSAADPRCA